MLISSVEHPMELADLTGKVLLPKMEIVTAAREAHIAGAAAAALRHWAKPGVIKELAGQMEGAARAVEFSARGLGCRLHLPVDAAAPHLPMMAGVGPGCLLLFTRRAVLGEFI